MSPSTAIAVVVATTATSLCKGAGAETGAETGAEAEAGVRAGAVAATSVLIATRATSERAKQDETRDHADVSANECAAAAHATSCLQLCTCASLTGPACACVCMCMSVCVFFCRNKSKQTHAQ